LQAAASFGGGVDEDTIYTVVGRVHPKEVQDMLTLAFKGDFVAARDRLRQVLIEYGLSASDIIQYVHTELFRFKLPERWKALLADAIGEVDFRISQGANDEVQFSALLAKFALAGEDIRRK
jgi:replication factor C small subunit